MPLSEVFPPNLVARALLIRGGAFSHEYEFLDEGLKRRFFFVVSHEPVNGDKIVLLTATTQIEKREAHHGARAKDVLVYLSKAEYPDLIRDSVIDCDCLLIKRDRATFNQHVVGKQYNPLPSLSAEVLARISSAVGKARSLSMVEKRLILGPDYPHGPST